MATTSNLFENILGEQWLIYMLAHRFEIEGILRERFGIDTDNLDAVLELVRQKKLSIVNDAQNNFIGLVANNRWIYTADGKIIGKTKHRFNL